MTKGILQKIMNSIYKKKKKSTSSGQLATCSLVCGIVGLFLSFFYLPVSLMNASVYPPGAIYGLNGIVLALLGTFPPGLFCGAGGLISAILSRRAPDRQGKGVSGRAIAGIILSILAIGLTFFFFYALITYYDALKDPVLGPQINSYLHEIQEQMRQQMQITETLPNSL